MMTGTVSGYDSCTRKDSKALIYAFYPARITDN